MAYSPILELFPPLHFCGFTNSKTLAWLCLHNQAYNNLACVHRINENNQSWWLQSYPLSTNNLKSHTVNKFFSQLRYQGTKILPDATPLGSMGCSSEKSAYTGKVIQGLSLQSVNHSRMPSTHFQATQLHQWCYNGLQS